MIDESVVDEKTGRKFYLAHPGQPGSDDHLTFLLNLHGGGSFGAWQRLYFPAKDYVDRYGLVVATPTAATAEPLRRWMPEADDEHLRNIVQIVFERFGLDRVVSFWLVGHSQGGMTSNRLLSTDYFAQRVDGWLSLSGGRFGQAEVVQDFGPPLQPGQKSRWPTGDGRRPRFTPPPLPTTDLSFIFATGEHEIANLPGTSPWADRFGAGRRRRLADVVDTEAGQTYDKERAGRSSKSWGLEPKPGTSEVYVYPDAQGGWVIADVVRLDKGHTEGLEPNITEELVKMMVNAPGGKAQRLRETV
jgi:pimeloyl-ACP methyl ester carboxylesterase